MLNARRANGCLTQVPQTFNANRVSFGRPSVMRVKVKVKKKACPVLRERGVRGFI